MRARRAACKKICARGRLISQKRLYHRAGRGQARAMNTEQQTWVALAVVALTSAIFLWRALRGKKSGCGGGCDCPSAKKPVKP